MAFFATIDRLPLARTQWRGLPNPEQPNPTVQPPVPPVPPSQPTEHHCTDGFTRTLVSKNGRGYWTCVGPIPAAYLSLLNANQQVSGEADTSSVPSAVLEDKVPEETKTPYAETTSSNDINENVEGN